MYTNGSSTAYDGPYSSARDGAGTAPVAPNNYPGWSVSGFYHTHRGCVGTGDPTGVVNDSHFSTYDISLGKSYGVPIYVAEYNALNSNDLGPAYRWYERDPNQSSDSSAKTVGQGGC